MNVRIVSEDASPFTTRVLTEAGAEIHGLTGITFRAHVDDINRADLELLVGQIDVGAHARVFVGGKEVRRIEYADGSVDEYPPAAEMLEVTTLNSSAREFVAR